MSNAESRIPPISLAGSNLTVSQLVVLAFCGRQSSVDWLLDHRDNFYVLVTKQLGAAYEVQSAGTLLGGQPDSFSPAMTTVRGPRRSLGGGSHNS